MLNTELNPQCLRILSLEHVVPLMSMSCSLLMSSEKCLHAPFFSRFRYASFIFFLFYRTMVLICYDRYIAYSMCSWQNLVSFQHGLFRVSFLGLLDPTRVPTTSTGKVASLTSGSFLWSTFCNTKRPRRKQKH